MIHDIILHTIVGLIAAATGYSIRATCNHRGWFTHPIQHGILMFILILAESIGAVLLIG